MNVRDKSMQNVNGEIIGHSSNRFIMPESAVVPKEKDYTEVSIMEGDVEICTGEYAGEGGGSVVAKTHGVKTAPGLMRAHQLGSATHDDYQQLHGCAKCVVATPNTPPQPDRGAVTVHLGVSRSLARGAAIANPDIGYANAR